ncbi:MAG: hypothetical protein HYW52_04660, partial [Gemmatimonadetes bacterium]|nr:hypothetical protein [Gemmatimonadota bacterium]
MTPLKQALLLAALAAAPAAAPAAAQAPPGAPGARREPKPLPLAAARKATFTATTGTWMSLDVS